MARLSAATQTALVLSPPLMPRQGTGAVNRRWFWGLAAPHGQLLSPLLKPARRTSPLPIAHGRGPSPWRRFLTTAQRNAPLLIGPGAMRGWSIAGFWSMLPALAWEA